MRLLLVDDDKDLLEFLANKLKNDFIIDTATSGESASYLLQVNSYDAIVLDKNLPDMDGVEICKTARDSQIYFPILILTAEIEVDSKVHCLNYGADDYLTKPFNYKELYARINSLIRRNSVFTSSQDASIEDLIIDFDNKTITRSGQSIFLRRKEFDLLHYLVINKGRVISKESLLDHIWDQGIDVSSNTLEVHIKYLRDKVDKPFEKKLIKTVHNFGYKIDV